MSKITDLEYCLDILSKEFFKVAKKYADIGTQINENYFLSEKKFDALCKKKDKIAEKVDALNYGMKYFKAEIEQLKYRERMRNNA